MRSRSSLCALAVAVLCSGCATSLRTDPEFSREAGYVIVTKAADIATTQAALDQGLVESNPFLGQDRRQAVLIQIAGTSAVIWYAGRLKADGNRHWKVPLRIWAVISGSAALWNASLLAEDYADPPAAYKNPLTAGPSRSGEGDDHSRGEDHHP